MAAVGYAEGNGGNAFFYTPNVRAHACTHARAVNCWETTVDTVDTVACGANPPRNQATLATVGQKTVAQAERDGVSRPNAGARDGSLLALDLGTSTGYALRAPDGRIVSGTVSFRPSRYDGGGMRYLRFRAWLDALLADVGEIGVVHYEEVRRHLSTDAAHVHGGLLATLTAWCEQRAIAYQGVPVATIKRHVTGKGNADKAAVIGAMRARGFAPADDNEADAIAILLWAIETRGGVR